MLYAGRSGRIRDFPHGGRGKPEFEFRGGPDCAGGDKADTAPK
jgi:hypothetical protein